MNIKKTITNSTDHNMKSTSITIAAFALITLPNNVSAQTGVEAQKDANTSIIADLQEDKQQPKPVKVPFEGMDLTWINGQNRQTDFPLQVNDKQGENILTATAFVDAYYNYNFYKPSNNTHTISAAIGRTNEIQLNHLSIGIE